MKTTIYSLVYSVILALFTIGCSGSESDEGQNVVTFITVSSSEPTSIIGKTINFKSSDNLNNDITEQSKFFVNGVETDNSSFTPTASGIYKVVAKMSEFESKPLNITIIETTGINFVHRMLFEDFTGTWCGNCPIAAVRYDNLVEQNNKVVLLGVHGPTGTNDPYTNPTAQGIIDSKGVFGYPTILLNGVFSWATNNNNYTDMSFALQYIQALSKMGIAVNSKLSGNNLTGDVKLSFAQNYSDLKIAVYIVENDLTYQQVNYFNGTGGKPILYGGVPIISNFSHHNVVRDKLTAVSGDAISSSQTQENMLFTKTLNYTVPANFVKEKLKIVVVIMKSNGEVINTREVQVNTDNQLETI